MYCWFSQKSCMSTQTSACPPKPVLSLCHQKPWWPLMGLLFEKKVSACHTVSPVFLHNSFAFCTASVNAMDHAEGNNGKSLLLKEVEDTLRYCWTIWQYVWSKPSPLDIPSSQSQFFSACEEAHNHFIFVNVGNKPKAKIRVRRPGKCIYRRRRRHLYSFFSGSFGSSLSRLSFCCFWNFHVVSRFMLKHELWGGIAHTVVMATRCAVMVTDEVTVRFEMR